jgi:hypothetical protein
MEIFLENGTVSKTKSSAYASRMIFSFVLFTGNTSLCLLFHAFISSCDTWPSVVNFLLLFPAETHSPFLCIEPTCALLYLLIQNNSERHHRAHNPIISSFYLKRNITSATFWAFRTKQWILTRLHFIISASVHFYYFRIGHKFTKRKVCTVT